MPVGRRRGRLPRTTIGLPANDEPYWFRGGHPLAGHRSRAELPASADVVVIGAGLTGAATAYHLAQALPRRPLRVVVVDQGDPAGEASGRNGGNFELIPENSVGAYEGLAGERLAFLRRVHRGLPLEVLRAESERQASLVLGLALRNRELFKRIILRERIACDFSPKGWLHLASSEEEEQGLCEEVTLAARHGQQIELWSRRRIRRELGIDSAFLARFVPEDGTYHPFKYVCGLLRRALAAGVELYTRVRVRAVTSERVERHRVVTAEGTILAGRVVVATNAFTGRLFPELRAIRPYQSQIQVTENVRDRTRGRAVTSEEGPVFFNQPRGEVRRGRALLLMGGGADRPMRNPSSRRRSPEVHRRLLALRDRFFPEVRGRPLASEWIGPLAFTPDQLPAIGFLRPGVVVAAGYNGYGGSYTTAAGFAAAEMTLESHVPDWVPEDVFSPRRLLTTEALFMTRRDSLWRIAASLCRQLKAVNHRIAETLALHAEPPPTRRIHRVHARPVAVRRRRARTLSPAAMIALPPFVRFTRREMATLLGAARRCDPAAGTVLFREGSPGGTCLIVVDGSVDVSIGVHGRQELLARLGAGSVFGQVSLIDGEPRTATCTVGRDAVLVELGRAACQRLLDRRSPLALKLLTVLNDGLIAALRGADRRLMRLELDASRVG